MSHSAQCSVVCCQTGSSHVVMYVCPHLVMYVVVSEMPYQHLQLRVCALLKLFTVLKNCTMLISLRCCTIMMITSAHFNHK